ncbi:hypothetical protein [Streptomyces prunicolor]|uniref:hypothetical protein n=1 Tax=Streptomyces prunicolor TaxID=67348 RepID=UPI00037F84CA|nr:hypothetical protein [Streptomyces prunicolor]
MKPFVPVYRGKPWVSGVSVPHLYIRPDAAVDTDLFALIAACRPVLGEYPIWCPSDDLVHITVEMNAAASSEEITDAQRSALIAELAARFADFSPFTVLCGSPLANRTGAILDTYPDHHLTAVRNLCRAALWTVHDTPAIAHGGGRGHMALGYAHRAADSDPLQSALRTITPSHATLKVSRLYVLDVRWTAHSTPDGDSRWEMSWEEVAVIPLGGKTST